MMVDPQWEAYQVGAGRCMGLDLKRSQYIDDFGNYTANSAATFRAGQLVNLNASQEVILDVGADAPFGVAKFDKTTSRYATVVGEYIQLNGGVATNLKHANLFSAAGGLLGVRVASSLTAGEYTEGADYTVSYVNGTITRILVGAGGTIPDGGYVYVNYMYALTAADELKEGRNFWLSTDDVTIQDNRITVITGRATLFTSQYDPSETYEVNDVLYSGEASESLSGYFTTSATSTFVVGKVFQVPTVDDPYLGVTFTG